MKRKEGQAGRGVRPYYFLVGEEEYLHKDFLRRLAASLFGGENGSLRSETFYAEAARLGEVLEAVQTPSLDLFSPSTPPSRSPVTKLVILKRADQIAPSGWKIFSDYFSHPPPHACLIFVVNRRPREWKIPAGASPEAIVSCTRPAGRYLTGWVREEARRRDLVMGERAVQELLLWAGPSLMALAGELDKLALYRGSGGEATVEDVRALASRSGEGNIFNLIRLIVEGRVEPALELTARLLREGQHPLSILSHLAGAFRRLWRGREAWERRAGPAQTCAEAGVKYYREEFLEQVRRFRLDRVPAVFRLLLESSLALKGETRSPGLSLERLVIDLCALGTTPEKARGLTPTSGH